jgi:histone-lysine N-methyltransferase SETD3
MHERIVRREHSLYWPYLRLLPTPDDMDTPAQWTAAQLQSRLGSSGNMNAAEAYVRKTKQTFESLRKIDSVVDFFPPGVFSFENYRWAAAILDSRSIWWEGQRHLVPMLDFINCAEGPDASRLHSTKQEGDLAVTLAPWAFEAGEQVRFSMVYY